MSLLSPFVEFLERLLFPDFFSSSSVPKFRNPPPPTETILNASSLWTKHLESLEREASGTDTLKLLECGREAMEAMQTLDPKGPCYRVRLTGCARAAASPELQELQELRAHATPNGGGADPATSSTRLTFSVRENERIPCTRCKASRSLHPGRPAVEMDLLPLSEAVVRSLCELGLLSRGQGSEALDTVCALRDAAELSAALPEPPRQEAGELLAHVYLHVFEDAEAARFLPVYSPFRRRVSKFLSSQSGESLLPLLARVSEQVLGVLEPFSSPDVRKALAFVRETAELLGELLHCRTVSSCFPASTFWSVRSDP